LADILGSGAQQVNERHWSIKESAGINFDIALDSIPLISAMRVVWQRYVSSKSSAQAKVPEELPPDGGLST
jgi:hypothetical protein